MLCRLLFLAVMASAAPPEPPPALFRQIDPILQGLSQITGWKVERKVPAEMLSRTNFRRTMEDHMKDTSPKELRAQELTLKMFGMVPQDFNLAGETVDLMSEQAAAFYDYTKKRLFVLDNTPPGEEQLLALAHELAHALADQHHPLGKYMRSGSPDDDADTARQAVMEGQATWLSWAYMSSRSGGKGEVPQSLLTELAAAAGASGADFPVFSNAPLYIRESLVFPYNHGTLFEDAVYRKLGRSGFDEVFSHPPQSTQEIIHPETYFAGKGPSMPQAPELSPLLGKKAGEFRVLTDGALGEFDFSALLRQYTTEREGTAAATHLRGASFKLYEHKREKYPVLTFATEWDSPEAARTFFELYRRVLQGKWKKMELTSESDSLISGSGDSGRFEVRFTGSNVQSIEGFR
jgi:hypothetical protein